MKLRRSAPDSQPTNTGPNQTEFSHFIQNLKLNDPAGQKQRKRRRITRTFTNRTALQMKRSFAPKKEHDVADVLLLCWSPTTVKRGRNSTTRWKTPSTPTSLFLEMLRKHIFECFKRPHFAENCADRRGLCPHLSLMEVKLDAEKDMTWSGHEPHKRHSPFSNIPHC